MKIIQVVKFKLNFLSCHVRLCLLPLSLDNSDNDAISNTICLLFSKFPSSGVAETAGSLRTDATDN